MKKKTIIIAAIVGVLTLSEIGILLLSNKTDNSTTDKKKTTTSDSTKKKQVKPQPPQLNQVVRDTSKLNEKKDTVDFVTRLKQINQMKSDSLALLLTALADEQKKTKDLSDQLKKIAVKQAELQDQKRKELQKIYNTMDAENAARIIEKLSDQDIVDILLSVQKRQAAKILASLDPTRAARLINQVNTNN